MAIVAPTSQILVKSAQSCVNFAAVSTQQGVASSTVGTGTRRSSIHALLARRGEAAIPELAERFSVSEMTIRRDLEALEEQGLVRRVRGGAISTLSRGYEPPFAQRAQEGHAPKAAIAAAAADQIEYGETAILDVGTTTLELARRLRSRGGLTIVTPNVRAALELVNEPNTRVILTGGIVRAGEVGKAGLALGEVDSVLVARLAKGVDVALPKGTTSISSPAPVFNPARFERDA